jgi:Uma2 family endonuclease
MKQPEFHRRYSQYPEDVKIELVGGVVYMSPPVRRLHGLYHGEVTLLLGLHRQATPGTEVLVDATTILDEDSEPSPDNMLRILSEYGGRSRVSADDYVVGPPELLAEVADSSRAIDLHQKRRDYERAGVLEYIVVCVDEQEIHWFHFPSRGRIRAGRDGVFRSKVFPGLWLNGAALLALDSAGVQATLEEGLASRAHAAFVKRLERARRRRP